MGLGNEESSITELDLWEFQAHYFILSSFQLIVPGLDDLVTFALDHCITFNKESLQVRLQFSLHHFIRNILDFYRIFSTDITFNEIWVIVVFILIYDITQIESRCSLFEILLILKKHP